MKLNNNWNDKYGPWAVVTGASSGIGAELAKALAKRGLNVVLSARNSDSLNTLATELQSTGVETRVIVADLSNAEGTTELLTQCQSLDIGLFIANAGFGTSGDFIDGDLETELNMIDLNTRFLARQTHHFANQFKSRGRGGIVLLSSIVSWQGVPRAANYAATKAYVQSLGEALHRELKPHGIDVLSSAPAQVNTEFMTRADMRSGGANARAVAENTLNALGKKSTVYPHFRSWFLSTALSMLPRRIRVFILAKVMGGMTAHQLQTNP